MDISSATARVAPDLLKTLAILSDITVRRSAADWEDLKPYWKPEKRLQEGKTKIKKIEFLKNKKSFIDEIKNIFHSF